jgi:hypothetical protein
MISGKRNLVESDKLMRVYTAVGGNFGTGFIVFTAAAAPMMATLERANSYGP